jgi:hypothetical protein
MSPKPTLLYNHYARLARLWPADPLRPHLAFRRVLLARRDTFAPPPPPAASAARAPSPLSSSPSSSQSPSHSPSPAPAPAAAAPSSSPHAPAAPPPPDLAAHQRAVNALYLLLDDRFARKVSATLFPPPFFSLSPLPLPSRSCPI